MKIRIQLRILAALIALGLCGLAYAAADQLSSRSQWVACDQNGLAFTMGENEVPWVMTDTGPMRGDSEGASLGYQMTCKEALDAFNM
jgi:hypothetical protein